MQDIQNWEYTIQQQEEKLLKLIITWVDLNIITLIESSQTKRGTYLQFHLYEIMENAS